MILITGPSPIKTYLIVLLNIWSLKRSIHVMLNIVEIEMKTLIYPYKIDDGRWKTKHRIEKLVKFSFYSVYLWWYSEFQSTQSVFFKQMIDLNHTIGQGCVIDFGISSWMKSAKKKRILIIFAFSVYLWKNSEFQNTQSAFFLVQQMVDFTTIVFTSNLNYSVYFCRFIKYINNVRDILHVNFPDSHSLKPQTVALTESHWHVKKIFSYTFEYYFLANLPNIS